MRTALTRTTAATVAAMMMAWVIMPITVAAAATATNVKDGDEAWFLAKREFLAEPTGEDPTCDLPTGCNVSGTGQRPSPHPEGVMVVAANSGDPDAQTFVNFDTLALPLGAVVTGGTLTLPVARDPDARNFRPEAAKMVACLVTGFIPGGTDGGSYRDRPDWDKDVCVDVKQAKADPLIYTVDLERFGKAWASGASLNGVTLMVDPQIKPPAPEETWRTVFNTQRRADQKTEEEKAKPEDSRSEYPAPSWTLQYRVEKLGIGPIAPLPGGNTTTGGGTSGNPFPAAESGSSGGTGFSGSPTVSSAGTGSTGGFDSGAPAPAAATSGAIDAPAVSGAAPVDTAAGPAAAPQEQTPLAAGPAQPAAAVGTSPAVWVLPLIALALAAAMAWSLMQPVELAGNREGAVSRLMRTRRLSSQNSPTPS